MTDDLEKEASLRSLIRSVSRARSVARAANSPSVAFRASAEKAPKGFKKGISEKDYKKAWKGYRAQGSTGTDSLLLSIPAWAAEKAFGKEKVRNFFWKTVNKPALRADMAAGAALGKIPGAKNLFTTKEKIPWGKDLHKDIGRASALAPLSKAKDVAAPIIIGVGLEKGIKKITNLAKGQQGQEKMQDQEMREKVASTMLRLHEENRGHTKRAHATRLLFKKAELGLEQIPQNYRELEEKIASLETQDLVVLEKALELTGGQFKLGELDSGRPSSANATEKFQAAIIGEEF